MTTPTPDDVASRARQRLAADALHREDDLALIAELAAEVAALRTVVRDLTPPTAAELAAHTAAGGAVERWHSWPRGGGWGLTFTGDERAWETSPPDEPQPGYRRALTDTADSDEDDDGPPGPAVGTPAEVIAAIPTHLLTPAGRARRLAGDTPDTPTERTDSPVWPEWLTAEHSNIHTAIENAMKEALAHCYGSADASGYGWTMEGLFSVAANSIMGHLRRAGCPPPDFGDVEPLPMPDDPHDYTDDTCATCDDTGRVPLFPTDSTTPCPDCTEETPDA